MPETVEELIEKYSRKKLDSMAKELGADTTDTTEFPNKATVAETILEARKTGVLAKRAAMDRKAKEIEKGVRRIQSAMDRKALEIDAGAIEIQKGIGAQAKENEEAVAKMHSNMKAQAKENADAVARIGSGVRELQNAAKEYINDFYYG